MQDTRVEHTFRAAALSWQFPRFYAEGETDETSSSIDVDGTLYGIEVLAISDGTPRSKAEELVAGIGADPASISEVRLGGRTWTAVVDDGEPIRRVALFTSGEGVPVMGAVFTATTSLDKVPEERIAELQQTVLSIRPANG